MKRIRFLLLAILLLGFLPAIGQVYWGPTGSINTYKAVFFDKDVLDTLDSKFRLGFSIGAFINVPLEDNYSLTTELNYQRLGRRSIIRDSNSDIPFKENYNFLEVPMMLRREFEVYLVENMKSAWHLEIGPSISYWMGGKGEFKDIAEPFKYKIEFGEPRETTDDIMFIENANRFLFGLKIGAGIKLQTRAREFVGIHLRYTHGQTFLGKKGSSATLSNSFIQYTAVQNSSNYMKVNYRIISIDVGYNFYFAAAELKKGQSISDRKKKVKRRR